MRLWVPSLASLSGLRIRCCCELWGKLQTGSDLVLLWLWRRLAAVAPMRLLPWEPSYAAGAALKKDKKAKKKNRWRVSQGRRCHLAGSQWPKLGQLERCDTRGGI